MQLTWYGTASLLLQEGDTCIAIDPFCQTPVGSFPHPPKELLHAEEYRQARHVFITHGHFDHLYHIPALYSRGPARIYCTAAPAETLLAEGFPARKLRQIRPGFRKTIGPFTLEAFPGRHCRFDLPLILHTVCRRAFWRHPRHLYHLIRTVLRHPEKGEILFYEISCGGQRIQVMGSLGLDAATRYPTGADLLILPFQGRSDLNTYALPLVERLKPGAILLDHCDNTFPPITETVDTRAFCRLVKQRFGIPCRRMTEGEPLYLKTDFHSEDKGNER